MQDYQTGKIDFDDFHYLMRCCKNSDGVWNEAEQECQAPSGDAKGTRQLLR